MWGSYVGAVISLIIFGIKFNSISMFNCSDCAPVTTIFVYFVIPLVLLGFLIGWGIHSLIRKLRRSR